MLNEARIRPPLDESEYMHSFPATLYNKSSKSHIARIIAAICGDAGIRTLRRKTMLQRLQSSLSTLDSIGLDTYFGDLLRMRRNDDEMVQIEASGLLTEEEMAALRAADDSYRERMRMFLDALHHGCTLEGIKLAAQAAVGYECAVYEAYRLHVADGRRQGDISAFGAFGRALYQEIMIVPLVDPPTEKEWQRWVRAIVMACMRVGSPDRIISVMKKSDVLTMSVDSSTVVPVSARASSERKILRRIVTAKPSWPFPYDPSSGYWMKPNESIIAPSPEHAKNMGDAISLRSLVKSVSASSNHKGPYERTHAKMFAHLRSIRGALESSPENALADDEPRDVYA